jgi:hypothetical protein
VTSLKKKPLKFTPVCLGRKVQNPYRIKILTKGEKQKEKEKTVNTAFMHTLCELKKKRKKKRVNKKLTPVY